MHQSHFWTASRRKAQEMSRVVDRSRPVKTVVAASLSDRWGLDMVALLFIIALAKIGMENLGITVSTEKVDLNGKQIK